MQCHLNHGGWCHLPECNWLIFIVHFGPFEAHFWPQILSNALNEWTLIGMHTSECTKSKGSLDLCSLCGKGFLMFFPKAQPLQWLCFSSYTWGTPMTACLKCFSAPWCKSVILLCHNSPWLLLLLLTRAFAGSKCSLYTFPLLPITRSKLLSDPLDLIYTLWSRNFT